MQNVLLQIIFNQKCPIIHRWMEKGASKQWRKGIFISYRILSSSSSGLAISLLIYACEKLVAVVKLWLKITTKHSMTGVKSYCENILWCFFPGLIYNLTVT
jgi:hypothetical protein